MSKTILLTGATAGIGLETAKRLSEAGQRLLLHGRSQTKLDEAVDQLGAGENLETYVADLSDLGDVDKLAADVASRHDSLDVLINNAGVYKLPQPLTASGHDIRFVVNTLAPYRLARRLLPLMSSAGRIVNLSSAAQTSVDTAAIMGEVQLDDMAAYAQSKLAITMWTRSLADELGDDGPAVFAVNPGSLLATRMVKEGFGVAGNDVGIGADILVRASLGEEFDGKSGSYFDNDSGQFAAPHPDGVDKQKIDTVMAAVESIAG